MQLCEQATAAAEARRSMPGYGRHCSLPQRAGYGRRCRLRRAASWLRPPLQAAMCSESWLRPPLLQRHPCGELATAAAEGCDMQWAGYGRRCGQPGHGRCFVIYIYRKKKKYIYPKTLNFLFLYIYI